MVHELEQLKAKLEAASGFLSSNYMTALVAEAVAGAVRACQSPWLDRPRAAEYCGCSVDEIDRAARRGVFFTYRRNETPLFRREDLDAAIVSGKWRTK